MYGQDKRQARIGENRDMAKVKHWQKQSRIGDNYWDWANGKDRQGSVKKRPKTGKDRRK